MWIEVVKLLGLFGIGTAALGWLLRRVIAHWMDKDVVRHRVNLEHAGKIEIERLQSDLSLRSIEHEVRFRSVYERQAMVIARTYQRLWELHAAVANYARFLTLGNEPDMDTKLEQVKQANVSFKEYYFPRRIFMPADTAQRVTEVRAGPRAQAGVQIVATLLFQSWSGDFCDFSAVRCPSQANDALVSPSRRVALSYSIRIRTNLLGRWD